MRPSERAQKYQDSGPQTGGASTNVDAGSQLNRIQGMIEHPRYLSVQCSWRRRQEHDMFPLKSRH